MITLRIPGRKIIAALLCAALLYAAPGLVAQAFDQAAPTDKTLVSWVALANLAQQGGSALTIQQGDQFDGIVFGEKVAGKWMAGSQYFLRTQGDQQANAAETADAKTLIQMAIVYRGDRISIYHDGEPYASYEASNVDLLSAKDTMAMFGLRHHGATTGQPLQGSIEDARIYDRALAVEEIRKLKPDEESAIKPYAWWTFEPGRETDSMGRFPVNSLAGGARIEDGRLQLHTGAAVLIAATQKIAGAALAQFETPAMPSNPPKTWLTYHLAHPGPGGAIPADPNPAFFYKGRYHLHYIYNHKDGFAFAHVSSPDMVHWKWHPTTLTPKTTGHGMFSGTGFFTKEGRPAMIYHGQGSDRNQLAFAEDDQLETWTKPVPLNPLDAAGKEPSIRHWDPDCWLNGDTYYAIAGGSNPALMKSKDLKEWLYLGELFHAGFPADLGVDKGEDTSCANMFKIGDKWMLLCISHGLGARYYLGDFKDEQFLPDHHALLNWARFDCFAPESLVTKDGRRVMWAWCTPWVSDMQKTGRAKNFDSLLNPANFQQGIQSLPRELSLPEDGVLRMRPLRELEELRCDRKREENITVKSDALRLLDGIEGDTMELEVVIAAPTAKEFGINVLCDEKGENGFTIASGAGSKTLTVGYVQPPFQLEENEDLTLRIFIDKSMIEVFANDRQAAVAWHEYKPENLHVSLFAKGGDLVVKRVTAWNMKSIYEGD
ncbi:MAG: GH32 C-terminal domain-containing protein, partial [Pirellulales bacterium]